MPQNAALLEFLRGQAALPKLGRVDDYDGYELHTHPDLISRLAELAPGRPVLPVYGVAVFAYEGIAAVVAWSMDHLMFRLPTIPADLKRETPIAALAGHGWHAVNAWQSDLPSALGLQKLSALVQAALEHAKDESSP
jgi:hypothetical protein